MTCPSTFCGARGTLQLIFGCALGCDSDLGWANAVPDTKTRAASTLIEIVLMVMSPSLRWFF
jgi:hypothetical protein